MATFNLSAVVTVSTYTTVEADTLEEAIEIAEEREVEMGGIQSGVDYNESWVVEEIDGTANHITED